MKFQFESWIQRQELHRELPLIHLELRIYSLLYALLLLR